MLRLETERLILRQWTQDDFEPFAEFHAHEATARFVGGVCARDVAWRRMAAIVGHWQLRGFGYWVLEERASGAFAGSVGLWFPEGWPELELGYWLLPEQHGKGLATEAAARAKQAAFDELQAETLVSYIDPANAASIGVAQRLGARCEETIELASHGPHQVYRYPR